MISDLDHVITHLIHTAILYSSYFNQHLLDKENKVNQTEVKWLCKRPEPRCSGPQVHTLNHCAPISFNNGHAVNSILLQENKYQCNWNHKWEKVIAFIGMTLLELFWFQKLKNPIQTHTKEKERFIIRLRGWSLRNQGHESSKTSEATKSRKWGSIRTLLLISFYSSLVPAFFSMLFVCRATSKSLSRGEKNMSPPPRLSASLSRDSS